MHTEPYLRAAGQRRFSHSINVRRGGSEGFASAGNEQGVDRLIGIVDGAVWNKA